MIRSAIGSLLIAISVDAFAPPCTPSLPSRAGRACGVKMALSDGRDGAAVGRRDALLGFALLPFVAGGVSEAGAAEGREGFSKTASGVEYKILKETTAPGDKFGMVDTATDGDSVIVQIRATSLGDGKVVMDTATDGKGFLIPLGKHKVIRGLEDGIEGMKSGEMRKLFIPRGELTKPLDQDLEVDVIFERKSGLMKLFGK